LVVCMHQSMHDNKIKTREVGELNGEY